MMLTLGKRQQAILFTATWVLLGIAYVQYAATTQRVEIESQLVAESSSLLRILSQRADQHTAHLTSLSALAVAGDEPERALFLQVADAIRQFYPRISAIDLVSLGAKQEMLSTRSNNADRTQLRDAIRVAAASSDGNLVLLASPMASGNYLIVKRSPNNEQARYGLAIEIDTRALLESDSTYWLNPQVSVALSLPDGTPLIKPPAETFDAKEASQDSLKFSKALTSRTQPLLLSTSYRIAAGDLLVNTPILFGLGIIAVILIIIFLVIHLLSRTRSAELRARHGEQEARIAHASRVNSLGEIASGLSHELTQPLTAILSQSQAGMHLISRGESSLPSIAEILQSNVRQSKRASNILSRLRDWSRQAPAARTRQALNTCIDNVASLLAADARSRGIELVIRCDESNPGVMGDAVEIEQLVFNLVRNAIEALERSNCANPRVQVSSKVSAQQVIVEVMDNGPGIAADMQPRLFEPFATDKENGMGIGLVLCERIVDRMEGSLEITAAKGGGVCARVSLPLA